jgi:Ca2+/Na+ antiporter
MESNVKIEGNTGNVLIHYDNRDLDRIAKLLEDYRKDTLSAYEKVESLSAYPRQQFIYLFIFSILGIDIAYVLSNGFPIILSSQVFLFLILLIIFFVFGTYLKIKEKEQKKENGYLIISLKKLAEVIQFASQTLEHQQLTDIRTFEFKLLLKDAEEVYQKAQQKIKT